MRGVPKAFSKSNNILANCVQVTCKVHKSKKPDDTCKQATCLPFEEGEMFARDNPLGLTPVSINFGKDRQIRGLTLSPIPLGL